MPKKKPELKTVRGLMNRAERFCADQNYFLLIYDVVGSRNAPDRVLLQEELEEFARAALQICDKEIFKDPSLSALGQNPFRPVLGDAGGVYLRDPKVIYAILVLSRKIISLPLRWNVARDEWDDKNMNTMK